MRTPSKAGQLRLTPAVLKVLLELQNGDRSVPQPLSTCKELVRELKEEAQSIHGGVAADALALAALEVARNLPRSSGWPTEQGLRREARPGNTACGEGGAERASNFGYTWNGGNGSPRRASERKLSGKSLATL